MAQRAPDSVPLSGNRRTADVNGGDDWVVPTLEYNGQWRPGQVYDPVKLEQDLRKWGLVK